MCSCGRSAARHAMQTCAPGEEQRRASWLKRQHVEVIQEEALLALEGSLPALAAADAEADEEAEERKRGRRRLSLKAPPNRETAISRVEATQLVQGVLPPGAAPPACIVISAGSPVPFSSQLQTGLRSWADTRVKTSTTPPTTDRPDPNDPVFLNTTLPTRCFSTPPIPMRRAWTGLRNTQPLAHVACRMTCVATHDA